MAFQSSKELLKIVHVWHNVKRYRGKITIQKPRPPHFERSVFIELSKPYFNNLNKNKPLKELCDKSFNPYLKNENNPFQRFIANELNNWFNKSRLIVFYHQNSMTEDDLFKAKTIFKKENMHLKNYGKKTMEMATKGTPYEAILNMYVSRNITLFSPLPDIKKVLRISKKFKQLILLAAIFEGRFITIEDLLYLNQLGNLQTAQTTLIHTLDSIGNNVVTQLNTHQNNLVQHLDLRVKELNNKE